MFRISRIVCVAMNFLLAATTTDAAEIKMLASPAVKAALEDIVPQFEKSSGHKVTIEYGTAAALREAIEKGAAFDVAVLNNNVIETLLKQNKLTTRTDLARSGTGVAVRKGTLKPDIATVESFKATLLAANSIAFVEQGATGVYLKGLFERLGIAEALKPKIRPIPGTTSAAHVVAEGGAELGITQVSEILPYPGAELAGLLPPDIRLYTGFAAALGPTAAQPEATKNLIAFMTTLAAAAVWRDRGLEPTTTQN